MANNMYDAARAAFAKGDIDWESDGFAAILVDAAGYVMNPASHTNLTHIPVPARVGVSVALANTVVDPNGAMDADDIVFPNVDGPSAEALVIYRVGASEAESMLVLYIDTATGLPITPNEGNIIVRWSSGADKIMRF